MVRADLRIDLGLDRGEIVGGQCGRVRKVEAEAVGGDEAALLGDVLPKPMAKRGMEQMGRAVIGADRAAMRDIDRLDKRVAELDRPFGDRRAKRVELAQRFRRRGNIGFEPVEHGQFSGVADLPAAFAVKRRLVEHDLDVIADRGAINQRAVLDDRQHHALAVMLRVTGEFGRAMLLGEVVPQFLRGLVPRAFPGGARGGFLLGHGGVEAGAVDGHAARAQCVFGEIVGEAESVVELERGCAGKLADLAHRSGLFVEQAKPVRQRPAELRFFLRQRRLDQRLGADQFGVGRAHFGDQRGHEAVH